MSTVDSYSLVLIIADNSMTDKQGIKYPEEGQIVAGGTNFFRGFLWGEGDMQFCSLTTQSVWIVIKVNDNDIIKAANDVKFNKGEVIYAGNKKDATDIIISYPEGETKKVLGCYKTAGDETRLIGGDVCSLIAGNSSSIIGGEISYIIGGIDSDVYGDDFSSIVVGRESTVISNDYSSIITLNNCNITVDDCCSVSANEWCQITAGNSATILCDANCTIVAGYLSTILCGDWSSAVGGYQSKIIGGVGSDLTGGNKSIIIGKRESTLCGGEGSALTWEWDTGTQIVMHTIYVSSSNTFKPNKKYKFDVKSRTPFEFTPCPDINKVVLPEMPVPNTLKPLTDIPANSDGMFTKYEMESQYDID